MRIRKRQVPLPLSSISSVPLSSSDPSLNRSPAVVQLPLQQQPPPVAAACFDPQYPSDHPNHPIRQQPRTQGRDSSAFPRTTTITTTRTAHGQELKKKKKKKGDYLVLKQGGGGGGEEERGGDGEKSNYTRKKSVLGAELGTGSLSESSSSHQAIGSCWGEAEKVFPLKKRRVSFERRGNSDDDDTIMEINTSNKMKIKMNKKFTQQQNDNEQEDKEIIKVDSARNTVDNSGNDNHSSAKKRGRGGAVMEGSRCSRVNGRGWRCCQQTLVGYSLCEHHLGKGRLRSMTSVRSRSLSSNNNNAGKEEEQPNNDDGDHDQQAKQTKRELLGESGENGKDQEKDNWKPLTIRTTTTKKRVKLGMVKARSISSLLGQNDNVIAVADDIK